jgi:hypothetical protein
MDLVHLASTDLPRDIQVQRNSGECIIQHGASKHSHRIEEDILSLGPKFEVSTRIRLEQSLGTTRNTNGGTKPWEAAASEVSSDVDRWKVGAGKQHTLLLHGIRSRLRWCYLVAEPTGICSNIRWNCVRLRR